MQTCHIETLSGLCLTFDVNELHVHQLVLSASRTALNTAELLSGQPHSQAPTYYKYQVYLGMNLQPHSGSTARVHVHTILCRDVQLLLNDTIYYLVQGMSRYMSVSSFMVLWHTKTGILECRIRLIIRGLAHVRSLNVQCATKLSGLHLLRTACHGDCLVPYYSIHLTHNWCLNFLITDSDSHSD